MNDTINRYLAILCYPFASLDFFFEDYLEEFAGNRSQRKMIENRLRAAVIRYVQRTGSVYSYDEIYLYLEKCYLYAMRAQSDGSALGLYLDAVNKIAESMISQRDGRIVFKYWENRNDGDFLGGFGDVNKIFVFHSLNMHVPLDFVVMFYLTKNQRNDVKSLNHYYGQIEVADQQLANVLNAGVAENHLHKGVSVSFFEIWDTFMLPLSSHSIRAFENIRLEWNDPGRRESEVLFYILAAAIARIWIAMALQEHFHEPRDGRRRTKPETAEEKELLRFIQRFENGKLLHEQYMSRWGNVKEKQALHEILLFYQKCWDVLLQMLPQQENSSVLREIFKVPDGLHTLDENIFLFYGMKYMNQIRETSRHEDVQTGIRIGRCLLQYLRVKNYLFGCTVQKKSIHGLDYFQKEYYNRDSGLNKLGSYIHGGMSKNGRLLAYWEQAMRKQFQNKDLKKVEFRMSIHDKESDLRREIRAFLEAYRNIIREDYGWSGNGTAMRSFPRVGLIFHLLKKSDETVPEKCALDGIDDSTKVQFGVLKETYKRQIRSMRRLRDEIPGLDRYIVGIDAASLENSTPVWAFTDVYEEARDSSLERVGYTGETAQSLRFTFHAGEDFRHILSGLRRMDETVTFLKFHAGDRIGHGTALGIMPERWRQANPFVVLPRIEALENYIWAHYTLSQDVVNFNSTLMAYLERRMYDLAGDIYGKSQGISIQVLTAGYLRMFSGTMNISQKCQEAADVGFCREVREQICDEITWNGENLAIARHCRKFLLQMEQPINFEVTEQDIQITKTLQKLLRRKLSREGIVVEINPSSNVAIGEIDRIADSQIYQLNSPDGADNVMVCINSDDPTVFHTNVSNELAYIYYGMLHNSVSRECALAWIDKVRECGVRSSFLQGRETDRQVYDGVERILRVL